MVAGYWVFFEGMLGVADGKLQEVHYSDARRTTEPVRIDSTGGWLGFTDKYWATVAHSRPDPRRHHHLSSI